MARRPRLFIRNIPYHIIQRGNNRIPIFVRDEDYLFFLKVLKEAKAKHPCFIYSYCLMPNHFHLLVEPEKEESSISLLIKLLGAKYVHYFNRSYNRSGTLWGGRFKCSLIDKELYFLTCLLYIEMNPVRAGILNSPEFYRWSSYRTRAFGEPNAILDLDPWYYGLGDNPEERQVKYRHFFQNVMPGHVLEFIRTTTNKNAILGGINFKAHIEHLINKKIIIRSVGRPKKGKIILTP